MTYTNNSNISIARARAPADAILIRRSAVDKLEEDVVARLVRWRLREDDDDEDDGAEGVPPDGDVIEVVEDVDAEGVDEALGDEDGGVDAFSLSSDSLRVFSSKGRTDSRIRIWYERRLEGAHRRDEVRAAEADTGCDGHLAE